MKLKLQEILIFKTIKSVAATGVDRKKLEVLTHSAPAIDFKLDFFK